MSESAKAAVGQRYLPRDRESFLDAQRRNRRATWRLSALCGVAAVAMGIPLALVVTPLIYAVGLITADIVNHFSPLPPEFWQISGDLARVGINTFQTVLGGKVPDQQTAIFGGAVMLLPGILLSLVLWFGINLLFHRSGVGGALLALKAREPNQSELKELQLADVVEEMAIAAGIPAPRVMLVDAPGANAAAIGTSPKNATVVVSRRLIEDLNRDELEGVLAHLIASIGNGDLKIAFRITAVFETCGLLVALINSPFGPKSRRVLWRIVRYCVAGSANSAKEAGAVADLLTRSAAMDVDDIDDFLDPTTHRSRIRSILNFIFFPIFLTNTAIKLLLWVFSTGALGVSVALLWRTRAYLADASAVQLTRNPNGLAQALEKLNDEPGEIPGGDWAAHLFIVSPKPGKAGMPDVKQRQMLAQAWAASGQQSTTASTSPSVPLDFAAMQSALMPTMRAAMAGDEQATARLRTMYQSVAAADPAFAAQIPNPDDFLAARRGDPAAIHRLGAARHRPAAPAQAQVKNDDDGSSNGSSNFIDFHPSMQRRLKRLARMGALVNLEAPDPKARMVALVIYGLFAPFGVAILGMLLLLIAVMMAASLAFMVIWLAFIHQAFALLAHH